MFDNTVPTFSSCVASDCMKGLPVIIVSELKSAGAEVIMAYVRVLPNHSHSETTENHK